MAVYDANSLARFIVSECARAKRPVSNLKLQKMLYFMWIDYYKETGKELFDNDICAWQLGPVVPDVYYDFCQYGGEPINREYSDDEDIGEDALAVELIEKYNGKLASKLVNKSHKAGGAWHQVYGEGEGSHDIIPFKLIKSVKY